MKKMILALSIIVLFTPRAFSQDINFSQFSEIPLLRNPSLSGLFPGDIRVTSAFRSQWGSVSVPYVTQALAADVKFPFGFSADDYLSVGLQLTNDVAGDSKLGKTQALPNITFHKSISQQSNTYFSIGFAAGAVNQKFDQRQLRFDDQFVNGAYSSLNPTRESFAKTNLIYYDATVGVLLSGTTQSNLKFYVGAAYFHFTSPRVAFGEREDIRLNTKNVFNLGMSLPVGDDNDFIVYADVFTQGGNSQGQGGILFRHVLADESDRYISFSAGSYYRWDDALIPSCKIDLNKWTFGLSYDANTSLLRPASHTRGAYELVLSYRTNRVSNSASGVKCPVSF